MHFRVSKYPIKIYCCSDSFYLFSVKFRNITYDTAFQFNETIDMMIENNILYITVSEIKDGYKIMIVYNGIRYNFELHVSDVGKWIDISLFY